MHHPSPRHALLLAVLILLVPACGDEAGTSVKYDAGDTLTADAGDTSGVDTSDATSGDLADVLNDTVSTETTDTFVPVPCNRNSTCPSSEVCVFTDDGSGGLELFCGPPVGTGLPGSACTDDSDCENGKCQDGICLAPCVDDNDCPGGHVCVATEVGGMTIDACVPEPTACRSNAACDPSELCVADRSGAALSLLCGAPVGAGTLGAACTQDSACEANLCLGGLCTSPCERSNDCSTDGSWRCETIDVATNGGAATISVCAETPPNVCNSDRDCVGPQRCVAQKTGTNLTFTCATANAGGVETGVNCLLDSDCAQNLCVTGQCAGPCQTAATDCPTDYGCDLTTVSLGGNLTDTASICQPPVFCIENDECLTSEVCFFRPETSTITTLCQNPNVGGGALGTTCTDDADCGANLCYSDRFKDMCTIGCLNNTDCATGTVCASVTLQATDGTSVSKSICVTSPATPCTSRNDCTAGTTCAIVPNIGGTALESVCIPTTGSPNGAVCTQDNNCASRVCLNNSCAAPCTSSTQCTTGQLCENNTVSKTPLSDTFELCEMLPDQICTSSSDCTDGVRVCGSMVSASTLELHCTFPNTGKAPIGDHCTVGADCFDNICLFASQECSVGCDKVTELADCGAGEICTSYRFSPGPTNVGLCNRSCADNTDCAGGTVGNICTINSNYRDNTIDQVCETFVGAGGVGTPCPNQNGTVCETGLCLRTFSYNNTPCSLDFSATACVNDSDCGTGQQCEFNGTWRCASNTQCSVGETCELLLDGTGNRECATTTDNCTALCNEVSDCTGITGNPLTACSNTTSVSLPNGVGRTNISTCARP
ncbi:MAG: hypothetical protein AUK47_28045 [Deltaproteobacteria bacterium CG2_30_63_29]|nr:MAG: hypothetical protein AUK47_28045 [Deltaproteobacteria bacterium CG2_30_63_29]PJB36656.1 MAG: hypothetical protein CO108_22825 [Deltaproteobacteria bacterium CG_4_9_14_3_um_filter_63_12]